MFIEQLLYTELSTAPATAAIVGTRIFPLVLPEGTEHPAIVVQRVSSGHFPSLSGDGSLERPRFQMSCYARSYSGAKTLAHTLKATMKASQTIKAISDNESDMYDEPSGLYRVVVDFFIWSDITG